MFFAIDTAAANTAAVAFAPDGHVVAEGGWYTRIKGRNDYVAAREAADNLLEFIRAWNNPRIPAVVCYEDTRFGAAGTATTGLLRGILFTELLLLTRHSVGALFAVSPSRWRSYHGVGKAPTAAVKLAGYRALAKDLGFESKLDTPRKRTDATAAFLIGLLGLQAWAGRQAFKAHYAPTDVHEMGRRIALDDNLWIAG